MRAPLLLAALTLAAPQTQAQQPPLHITPRDWSAHVTLGYLDGSDRGVGWYQSESAELTQRLSIRGTHVELAVRGRSEIRGAFLSPGGPSGERVHESEIDETWTGDVRREGDVRWLHFTHTTSTRPARECDETFRCAPDPTLRDTIRCTATRDAGHHGNDRLIPSYLRMPLLLGRGRTLQVRATGSDSGTAHVEGSEPRGSERSRGSTGASRRPR
ncbi:MAG: hypothetical protein R3B99_23250 [Polyangiales bacterium]